MKRGANSEHKIFVCKYDIEDKFSVVNVCTVEPQLSGPRLSGFLDYPDFFCGPNLVMNIY